MINLRQHQGEETGTSVDSIFIQGGVSPEHAQQVRRARYGQTSVRKTAAASGSYPLGLLSEFSTGTPPFSDRNLANAIRYIEQFPNLKPILVKARAVVQEYFPDATIRLSVAQDHENDLEQLFVYIYTSLPVEEALSRLNKLDDEWYLDVGQDTNWRFNFNLRFGRV